MRKCLFRYCQIRTLWVSHFMIYKLEDNRHKEGCRGQTNWYFLTIFTYTTSKYVKMRYAKSEIFPLIFKEFRAMVSLQSLFIPIWYIKEFKPDLNTKDESRIILNYTQLYESSETHIFLKRFLICVMPFFAIET